MNAVTLVQRRVARDAKQQKWHKPDVVFLREVRIHLSKSARVFRSVIRRRFHAREHHGNVPRLRAFQDECEVFLHLIRRQPAQAIVGAQREHERMHIAIERPVEPPRSARGRITRYAGVDDLEVVSVFLQLLADQRRIALIGRQTQTGGKTISKKNNSRFGCRRRFVSPKLRRTAGSGGGRRGRGLAATSRDHAEHTYQDDRTHQDTVMTSAVALSVVPRVIASLTSFAAPSAAVDASFNTLVSAMVSRRP